jgi:hypothetical protein
MEGLLEELFNPKGKMYTSEANMPDHKFVKTESNMYIDGPKV